MKKQFTHSQRVTIGGLLILISIALYFLNNGDRNLDLLIGFFAGFGIALPIFYEER